MAILLFLIPISLLLLGVAIWAFVWSVRGGQYDDLDTAPLDILRDDPPPQAPPAAPLRSEEHTSELQSLMRISYAVFCLKKKKHKHIHRCLYPNNDNEDKH